MRICIPIFTAVLTLPMAAQNIAITPTEELRANIRQWVETMQSIQQEENDWSRDQEVLQNYKNGLESEIADLKQQIADAKTRKKGADSESLEQSDERDRLDAPTCHRCGDRAADAARAPGDHRDSFGKIHDNPLVGCCVAALYSSAARRYERRMRRPKTVQ